MSTLFHEVKRMMLNRKKGDSCALSCTILFILPTILPFLGYQSSPQCFTQHGMRYCARLNADQRAELAVRFIFLAQAILFDDFVHRAQGD